MKVGQHVRVKPSARRANMPANVTFEVMEVVDTGGDAFRVLKASGGSLYRWFRSSDVEPEDPGEMLLSLATAIARERHISLREALGVVQRESPAIASRYRDQFAVEPDVPASAADKLMTLAHTIAADRRISLRDAIREAGRQQPDTAARYHEAFNAGLRADR